MIEESGRSEVGKGGGRARGLVDGLMWLWGRAWGALVVREKSVKGVF